MAALGAYGLALPGLLGASRWMQPQEPGAPELRVLVELAPADTSPTRLDGTSANIGLIGGARLVANRDEGVVTFLTSAIPPDEDLLHPYLAPGAALFWQWAGREALHAGAFCVGDRAILLFGEKGAGKSSTLAWLAAERSVAVLADDLAVLDAGRVLAGPRSIDMRPAGEEGVAGPPGAAASSGAAVPSGAAATPEVDRVGEAVRAGARLRVRLPQTVPAARLAGCVMLRWDQHQQQRSPQSSTSLLEPVQAAQRLGLLARQRTYARLPGDPRGLLDLAALPMFTLTRAEGLDGLPAAADALLERFS